MKKPLRILLILVATCFLLVALVIALALTPGVQTWAARKFAPATGELTVEIGRVEAGLNQTHLENIRVVRPGMVLTLPSLDIDVSVVKAANSQIEVKQLIAKGWTLDMTAPRSGTTGNAPASGSETLPTSTATAASKTSASTEEAVQNAFDGVFKLIALPVDLSVDGVSIEGEVILPQGRVQVAIKGGNLSVGKDGGFNFSAELKTADSTVVNLNSDLTVHMNTSRSLDRLGVKVCTSVKGPQVPQGATLDFATTLEASDKGERYLVSVRSAARDLATIDLTLPNGTGPLSGTWSLDTNQADVAPFALGQALPECSVTGQGQFSADRLFKTIQAAGSLTAVLDKLAVIQPELSAIGRLVLTSSFDVGTQGATLRVNALDVRLTAAKPVLSVVAMQPIEFEPASASIKVANPAEELARLSIDGVPLAWAKPFLADLSIKGDDLRGSFSVKANEGGFAVRPVSPMTLTALSVDQAGKPLVRDLNLKIAAQADYSPKGLRAEISDLTVGCAGKDLFKLNARAEQAPGVKQPQVVSGNYAVDVAELLRQPVVQGLLSVKAGTVRGDFSAAVGDNKRVSCSLKMADLVAGNEMASRLAAVELQAHAEMDLAGNISASIPVVITQGSNRSDINLSAVVSTIKDATKVSARLSSDLIYVTDLMAFTSILPASTSNNVKSNTAPAKPTAAPKVVQLEANAPQKSSIPLWAGLVGDIQLDFKKIIYSPDLQVNDVGGFIKLTPTAISFEKIRSALSTGGSVNAGGALEFDAAQTKPYALKADVALTNIEPAPLLRALSGNEGTSPVDGKYNVSAKVGGRADALDTMGNALSGEVLLSSRGGAFRALSIKTASKVEKASKVVAIAGLVGALSGNEALVKNTENVRPASEAAAEVAKQLSNLAFDDLKVDVAIDDQKNLIVKNLTLLSPSVRLIGSGKVTYQAEAPFYKWPLQLNLSLGARDQLADALRTLKLLDGKTDAQGYAFMREGVAFDGTLISIGCEQLNRLIQQGIMGAVR